MQEWGCVWGRGGETISRAWNGLYHGQVSGEGKSAKDPSSFKDRTDRTDRTSSTRLFKDRTDRNKDRTDRTDRTSSTRMFKARLSSDFVRSYPFYP
jgi:hypothetical protein